MRLNANTDLFIVLSKHTAEVLMIIGDTNSFAIAFEISEFVKSHFIGIGSFNVYIKETKYGRDDKDATTFFPLIEDLKTVLSEKEKSSEIFINGNEVEICKAYYEAIYIAEELNKKYFGYSYTDFYNKILQIPTNIISWDFIGEAFDDGSHMLQINDMDRIKLLGFKSTAHCTIKDIKYVVISRNQFEFIINEFIETIKQQFQKRFCLSQSECNKYFMEGTSKNPLKKK